MIFDHRATYRGQVKKFKFNDVIETLIIFLDPDRQKINMPARPSTMSATSMKMNLPGKAVTIELMSLMDRATVEHVFTGTYLSGSVEKWDMDEGKREFRLRIVSKFTDEFWQALPVIKGNEYFIRITEAQAELDFDKQPPSQCVDCGEVTEALDDAGRCDECKAAYPEEEEQIQTPETGEGAAPAEPADNDIAKHAQKRMGGKKKAKK